MAKHFAKVLGGKVLKVIVAEPDFFDSFVDNSPGDWIETDYDTRGNIHYGTVDGEYKPDGGTPLRKNYAWPGHVYDVDRDAFYTNQPFPSWTLNNTTCLWEAPLAEPTNPELFYWDEEAYQADNTKGWVSNAKS